MSGTVELRRGVSRDAGELRRLTRAAYAKWVPIIGREPKPMGADYEEAVESHRFDLIYVDGVLAGLIETIDEGDSLLVENLAVDPDFQGRGLGSALLAHAEEIARAAGHARVTLYTNQRFAQNIELYLRRGYSLDREEDLGAGMVRVNMSKDLSSPTPSNA